MSEGGQWGNVTDSHRNQCVQPYNVAVGEDNACIVPFPAHSVGTSISMPSSSGRHRSRSPHHSHNSGGSDSDAADTSENDSASSSRSAACGEPRPSNIACPGVPLHGQEGQRYAAMMGKRGLASLSRWFRCWEPQVDRGSCAAASAVAALTFMGMGRRWSQNSIYREVVNPRGLSSRRGVTLAQGVEMLSILGAGALQVEERCFANEAHMSAALRADLDAAFSDQAENFGPMCLLANYWRPTGGHWSPLGGWAEEKVLIMDTNDQRYPPHWVDFASLVRSFCRHNEITGRPRGYVVLRQHLN